jgi:capsular exopolysaccharide synthesis family protein
MNVVSIRRRDRAFDESLAIDEEEQGSQLRNLYGVVLRRWRVMAAAGVVLFGLIAAHGFLTRPIYTGTALVMVSPGPQQVLAQGQMINDSSSGGWDTSGVVDSEIEVLRSDLLASRLVTALHLDQDPEWNGDLRPPGLLASLTGGASGAGPSSPEALHNAIASGVASAITVRRKGLSYGIEVSADAGSPDRAAQMANKLVDLYLQAQTEARFDAAQRANGWLAQRLDELRQEVEHKEQAAETFRVAHGLSVASGGDVSNQQPQSAEVQTMLVQASADLAEKEARLRQVQSLLRSGGSADSMAETLNSPVIGQLRQREAELTQSLAELRQRYSVEHPSVTAAQTELDSVHQRIQDEIRRITASQQNDVDVARARLATLQASFGTAAGSSNAGGSDVIQYRELVREAAAARAVHESFLERFHELANQGDLPVATSRMVSPATPPDGPSKPNMTSVMLIALLIGTLGGGGLGFLIEMLDASVSSPEDAERKLNTPALASIPILKPNDMRGLALHQRSPTSFVVEKPMSGFAESVRVLRTALTHARLDRKLRVLAVTSALPDEGKTTTSVCLGRIAAMGGQRVLIVDCDLRRRSLSEVVGVHAEKGLLDVLGGEANWREAVLQDPESGAHVLATRATRFTPRDVFASDAMSQLIGDLRGTYDLIILDCAPVLAVAETRTVAGHADLSVVVVRSSKTSAAAVRTAMRELDASGVDVAGVALNYIDPRRPGRGSYGDALYYRYARSYYRN